MKKTILLFLAVASGLLISQLAGASVDVSTLTMLAGVGMITFIQKGDALTLTPAAAVVSGVGYLFGTGLFGVAVNDCAANVPGEFLTRGVVLIAKTNTLAINVGDRVYWDATNKCVNVTATAQQCVGICVEAVAATTGLITCKIKLGAYVAVAA